MALAPHDTNAEELFASLKSDVDGGVSCVWHQHADPSKLVQWKYMNQYAMSHLTAKATVQELDVRLLALEETTSVV